MGAFHLHWLLCGAAGDRRDDSCRVVLTEWKWLPKTLILTQGVKLQGAHLQGLSTPFTAISEGTASMQIDTFIQLRSEESRIYLTFLTPLGTKLGEPLWAPV